MSNTFVELDFGFSNPILAPLGDIQAPDGKNVLDVPFDKLPESLAKPASTVFQAIFGKSAEPTDTLFRLAFRAGKQPKLYVPTIARSGEHLALRWGNSIMNFSIGKNELKPIEGFEGQPELEFSFGEAKLGQYNEPCLFLTVAEFAGFDEITMPLAIRKANYEVEFDISLAKQALKKGDAKALLDMFGELKVASGEGSVQGDVYGNDVLPQGVDIKIIKAVARDTSYGRNYILTAEANAEIGLEADTNFWGFGAIKRKLGNGAIISPDKPAKLNFIKGKNAKGETRYQMSFDVHWPESADSIKLSDLLATW